jgi:hypothetical protein
VSISKDSHIVFLELVGYHHCWRNIVTKAVCKWMICISFLIESKDQRKRIRSRSNGSMKFDGIQTSPVFCVWPFARSVGHRFSLGWLNCSMWVAMMDRLTRPQVNRLGRSSHRTSVDISLVHALFRAMSNSEHIPSMLVSLWLGHRVFLIVHHLSKCRLVAREYRLK